MSLGLTKVKNLCFFQFLIMPIIINRGYDYVHNLGLIIHNSHFKKLQEILSLQKKIRIGRQKFFKTSRHQP